MFERILVALDQSVATKAVFEQSLSLAKQNQAGLMLLHVLSGDEKNSPWWISTNVDSIDWQVGAETDLDNWRRQWKTY